MKNIIDRIIQCIGRRHWLRFGVRDNIARIWNNPETATGDFEEDFYGLKYSGSRSSFIDWSVYYFGAYSEKELIFFSEYCRACPRPVVLDVGANVGHHTIYYSKYAKTVHAFEPLSSVADKLSEKIVQNGISNVAVHRFGLGAQNALVPFRIPISCNSGVGSFAADDGTGDLIELEVRNGDMVIEELNLDRIDFIKIDVEGFEPEVLKGLKETIRRHRPVLFIEWSQNERAGDAQIQQFLPSDYLVYDFDIHLPSCIVLQFEAFRMQKLTSTDGNKVAIPAESAYKASDR